MGYREDMIAAYGFRVEAFEIDGRPVYFRRLMGGEGEQLLGTERSDMDMAAALLYFSLCDESGALQFTDADDVKKNLGVEFINKAGEIAMRFNGLMGREDEAGKSGEIPDGGSPSG